MKAIVKRRPSPYPLTERQQLMKEAAIECGIVKGISRADLVKAMKECIPEFYRKKKEGSASQQNPSL